MLFGFMPLPFLLFMPFVMLFVVGSDESKKLGEYE